MHSTMLAMLLLAQGSVVQSSPQGAPEPSRASLQDTFNTASAAWEAVDCVRALPLFDALAADPRLKPGSLPAAAVGLRSGDCMVRSGRQAEGEARIAAALPVLRAAGKEFDVDVGIGYYQLGVLAMERWDHDTALAHLRAALAVAQGEQRLRVLSLIAQLTAFDGGREGLDAADEGLRLVQLGNPSASRMAIAQWHTLHARILLNQGQTKAGRDELRLALSLSGGEKERVSLGDALLRADLAQAAMLDHDKEDAYKFMAMSGAGRVANSPFANAVVMAAPSCGVDTGLEPQDMAVVEFAIGDDGQVISAQPVFSTANYAKATAFARAVRQWAWKPEDVGRIPVFFRAASRMELHCSNAGGTMSPLAPLMQRFDGWARAALAPYLAQDSKPGWPPLLDAARAAQGKGDVAGELAARTLLANVDLRPVRDIQASLDRAGALVVMLDQPEPRAAARVLLAVAGFDLKRRMGRLVGDRGFVPQEQDDLLVLARDPQIAADPLAQDSALLQVVVRRWRGDGGEQGQAVLLRVAGDARLGDRHPLRQFAQLRLANDAARKGNLASAQQFFKATGLDEEQCALIGPQPVMKADNSGGNDFPDQPLRWGFEGWARTEFDIAADGHTLGMRTLAAYPPFVFSDAARRIVGKARYQSSYRPGGGAACSANTEVVNFLIPGNTNTVKMVKKKT